MDKLLDDLDVAIRDLDWLRVRAAAAALRATWTAPVPVDPVPEQESATASRGGEVSSAPEVGVSEENSPQGGEAA